MSLLLISLIDKLSHNRKSDDRRYNLCVRNFIANFASWKLKRQYYR